MEKSVGFEFHSYMQEVFQMRRSSLLSNYHEYYLSLRLHEVLHTGLPSSKTDTAVRSSRHE